MGLLDLQTDLKSYKFGIPPASDRPGGGNSGEPYIKKSIDRNTIPQSEDFLLRGGINAPLDAATDVARLAKFFTDLKSPRGALFVAKQNLLSRTGVATQASDIIDWKNAPLNEGVYTPLSTLAQAGIGFTGGHIPKQGAIPFMGVRTYTDAKFQVIGAPSGEGNRLVNLYNEHIGKFSGVNLLSYSGGPNSDLGIGKTNIKFATDNKGGVLKTLGNEGFTKSFILNQTGIGGSDTDRTNLPTFYSPLTNEGVTNIFKNEFNPESIEIGLSDGNDGRFGRTFQTSVYNRFSVNDDSTFPLQSTDRIYDNGALTWDQEKIEGQTSDNNSKNSTSTIKEDFRRPLLENAQGKSTIMSLAPSYNPKDGKTIDGVDGSRINMTSPGQKGNIISYTAGKIVNGRVSTVDKINAQPIYQSNQVSDDNDIKNDLVKFRIAAINNEDPTKKQYIHFRAYIDSFSDAYNANWNEEKYLGRGESFWKYGGFARTISLGFTVAAQSKPELIAQYKKLNFLASNLAPTYSSTGYMGGPLVQLTLGGWCYELPGFITSMTLDVPQESPWEIGINDEGGFDPTVKEMPHIVKVTGFSFTPIHTFRPEKQQNLYGGEPDGEGNISKYGPQRYVALKATNSNYDDTIN